MSEMSDQARFDTILAAHSSEIDALRRIADETRDGIRSVNERLGDLIRISERQAVQAESIGRAFSLIGGLGGRVDDLANRTTIIETNHKSTDRERADRDREVSRMSGRLDDISLQVSALKQTKETAAAIGGPVYAGVIRFLVAVAILALTGLVGFIARGELNDGHVKGSSVDTGISHTDIVQFGPSGGPELSTDGRDHGRDSSI